MQRGREGRGDGYVGGLKRRRVGGQARDVAGGDSDSQHARSFRVSKLRRRRVRNRVETSKCYSLLIRTCDTVARAARIRSVCACVGRGTMATSPIDTN